MSNPSSVPPMFPNPTILPNGNNDKLGKGKGKFNSVNSTGGITPESGAPVKGKSNANIMSTPEGIGYRSKQREQSKADRFGFVHGRNK